MGGRGAEGRERVGELSCQRTILYTAVVLTAECDCHMT